MLLIILYLFIVVVVDGKDVKTPYFDYFTEVNIQPLTILIPACM